MDQYAKYEQIFLFFFKVVKNVVFFDNFIKKFVAKRIIQSKKT